MPTALTLDLPKLATMFLTEDGADVPSSFSNIVCNASNLAVFGFLPQADPNTLPLGIKGPGSASLSISADCSFSLSGVNSPQRKTVILPVAVILNGGEFEVSIGN